MRKINLSRNAIKFLFMSICLTAIPNLNACNKSNAAVVSDGVNITPLEANQMISQNPNLAIIDVRTAEEFNQAHVKNAVNIDYNGANFDTEISKLPKDKSYIVYCRSGNRSRSATASFKSQGFTNVHNVSGGISSWSGVGLP